MADMSSEKKSEKLELRITPSEKEALRAEAESKGLSVSELVRKVLSEHIMAQPYWRLASQPIKQHPRKFTSGLIAILSAIGIGVTVLPAASAQNLIVDLSGKIEGQSETVRTSQAFSTALTLKVGEPALIDLPPSQHSKHIKPAQIEVTVFAADQEEYSSERPLYQLAIRIIEDEETIIEPKMVAEVNKEAKLVYGIDPIRTYTISAVVKPQ